MDSTVKKVRARYRYFSTGGKKGGVDRPEAAFKKKREGEPLGP